MSFLHAVYCLEAWQLFLLMSGLIVVVDLIDILVRAFITALRRG